MAPSSATLEQAGTLTRLERRRDERLLAVALAAVVAVAAGVLAGRAPLVVFAAPLLLGLLIGRRARVLNVRIGVESSELRVVEGDRIELALTVVVDGAADPDALTVEALLKSSRALQPIDGTSLSSRSLSRIERTFVVGVTRWGRFLLGPVVVRIRDPDSMWSWQGMRSEVPELVALPTLLRLDDLLEPRSARTSAGAHPGRRSIGAGMDFAELRAYESGDRLRDLNRSATGRAGRPIVNRYHPERSGDVIIVVDTYVEPAPDLSEPAQRALVAQARAVWAIGRAHLAAQDRVGVATIGRLPIWLPPAAGARARYAILEALLAFGRVLDGSEARSDWLNTSRVPPSALVVFLTPLWSDRYTGQIVRLQARGRETAVVRLRTEALLGPVPADGSAGEARRLFDLLVADRADELRRSGINLVEWDPSGSLTEAVSAAARSQVRRRTARSA